MKKLTTGILFIALTTINSLCFGTVLHSINKTQFNQSFVNKTFTSIPTDNLNGHTIDNTFSMYLDGQGNIWGKMSHKPANEPQVDKGIYTITNDGTFYITWQHWDGAKKLCGHIFNTQNAYISVDCDNVFHTVFMKEASRPGNHLK
jgi:hypothetical protein